MDDLRLMRELGDETPLPALAELAPAREKLTAGMTPVRLRRRRTRFLAVGGTTVGLAAAVAAVITPAPVDVVGGPVPVAQAGEVLGRAATAARLQPDLRPRPDQFVYTAVGQGSG